MKKFLLLTVVIFSLFIVSCGDSDDTGDTDDIDNTGSDDDADGTEETVYDCVGISVENITIVAGYSSYEGTTTTGDEALEDGFSLQFYKEDLSSQDTLTVGTYDLAAGLNANYSSCTECALVYEDLTEDENGSAYAKSFFQMEGSLNITEVKKGTIESKGTLTAKVVEVTIAEGTFESTPVSGGGCYEIQTSWDTICVPDCTDKICGDDGCGGSCGEECGEDLQCSEDGTECIGCTAITLGDIALQDMGAEEVYWVYGGTFTPNIGDGTIDDALSLQFYAAPEAKEYDLAGTNFATCNECILVFEDANAETGAVARRYFQEKGKITVESFDGPTGNIKTTVTGLQLREATIDTEYTSTFVKNSKCLILETGNVEVISE